MIATCYYECEFPSRLRVWALWTYLYAAYTLAPLASGYVYPGPSQVYSSQCECSTIGYSLISACDACQGQNPFECDHICFFSNFSSSWIHPFLAGLHM